MAATGIVNSEAMAILDGIINDPAYGGHATLYIGLSSTAPAQDGTGFTEPSGGAYARVSTVAADWSAAAAGAAGYPCTKTNTAVKTFPQATADWASGSNMVAFGLLTASSGGNPIWVGALSTPKYVLNGDTASFAAGALVLKLGDSDDTY
jgi:hypothetical protein